MNNKIQGFILPLTAGLMSLTLSLLFWCEHHLLSIRFYLKSQLQHQKKTNEHQQFALKRVHLIQKNCVSLTCLSQSKNICYDEYQGTTYAYTWQDVGEYDLEQHYIFYSWPHLKNGEILSTYLIKKTSPQAADIDLQTQMKPWRALSKNRFNVK